MKAVCFGVPSVLFLCFLTCIGFAGGVDIDGFDYPTSEEVNVVWKAGGDSPQAYMGACEAWGEGKEVVFPLNLTDDIDRNYWDRDISLDLSSTPNFALRLFILDPSLLSRVTLYFRSPEGWSGSNVKVQEPGWQTLEFTKGTFWDEDGAFDWKNVEGIRLSFWKKREGESVVALDGLSGFVPPVVVVRGRAQKNSSNEYYSKRMATTMSDILASDGIPHGIIEAEDVENGSLAGCRLAIFPFNVDMSTSELDQIEQFVREGGKMIHFYELPTRLAELMGFRESGWTREEYPGQFSACRFSSEDIAGLPERMTQHSWNVRTLEPKASDAHVIAHWENEKGEVLSYPAWLASSTGAFMSHILLNEDKEATRKVMMALVGYYCPEVWPEAAKYASEQIGCVGEFEDYDELLRFVESEERAAVEEEISAILEEAKKLKSMAEAKRSAGDFPGAFEAAVMARRQLVDAYLMVQKPKAGEFRAVWEHSGLGVYPGDWEKSVVRLKEAGFRHIIPNMMNSGTAVYASDYVPRSKDFESYGDQIAACVEAAHEHGLKVHVWKVNFNLGAHFSQEWLEKLRREKRTQVDVEGNPVNWLCPSNPENVEFETNVMLEVVRNYDVDGIHFDYIRYPDEKCCYCDGCRERFEKDRGVEVTQWPDDCYGAGSAAGEYRAWRCEQITRVVKAVSEGSREIKPDVQISAAVFSRYPECREQRGQDWVQWIRAGYLDFVCPMDYTDDLNDFREMVSEQKELIGGLIPLYPGISVSSRNLPLDGLIAQIRATRTLGADGFTIFQYDKSSDAFDLPRLGERITAPK